MEMLTWSSSHITMAWCLRGIIIKYICDAHLSLKKIVGPTCHPLSSSLLPPPSLSLISLCLSLPFLFPFGRPPGARAGATAEASGQGTEQRQQRSRRFWGEDGVGGDGSLLSSVVMPCSYSLFPLHPISPLTLSSPCNHGSLSPSHVSNRHGAKWC